MTLQIPQPMQPITQPHEGRINKAAVIAVIFIILFVIASCYITYDKFKPMYDEKIALQVVTDIAVTQTQSQVILIAYNDSVTTVSWKDLCGGGS